MCLWQNRGDDKWGTRILATPKKKKKTQTKIERPFRTKLICVGDDCRLFPLIIMAKNENFLTGGHTTQYAKNPCVIIRDTPNNGV